jgi:hypothetical protein
MRQWKREPAYRGNAARHPYISEKEKRVVRFFFSIKYVDRDKILLARTVECACDKRSFIITIHRNETLANNKIQGDAKTGDYDARIEQIKLII